MKRTSGQSQCGIELSVFWSGLIVIVITMLSYSACAKFGFLNYDDPQYITTNKNVMSGFNLTNVQWALSNAGETNLWHPLTFMSHQLDVAMFGMNAGMHHVVNVVWHSVAALLLFFVARPFLKSNILAVLVALIWALHPEKIQSVAWLSERKDVLSGAFFFGSILCFLYWVRGKKMWLYGLSLGLYICALLSKPSVVPLPLVLFILCYAERPLMRSLRAATVVLLPFIVVSVLGAGATIYFQSQGGLAMVGSQMGVAQKLLLLPVSFSFYIERLFRPVPHQLWFYSEYSTFAIVKSLLIVSAVIGLVVWLGRRERLIWLGFAMFTVLWLPVSGLVTVSFYAVADRYSYLPQIGIILMLVGLVKVLIRKQLLVRLCLGAFLVVGFVILQLQLPLWKSNVSLFAHECEVNPRSLLAPIHLGNAIEKDSPEKALELYKRATEIDSGSGLAYMNMGRMFQKLGQKAEALKSYKAAVAAEIPSEISWSRLFALQIDLKQMDDAGETVTNGLEQFPKNLTLLTQGSMFYSRVKKDYSKSIELLQRARQINPANVALIRESAHCYYGLNDLPKTKQMLNLLSPADRSHPSLQHLRLD